MSLSPRALLPAAFLVLSIGVPRLASAGPMAQLRKARSQINRLARQKVSDARLKTVVNRLLDFDTMAELVLRSHWSGLTPAQRTLFKKLFRQLIEKNYIRGIRKNVTFQVDYKREVITGKTAKVHTVVRSVRRGRPRQTEVVYRMKRSRARWRVIDLVTDDVSLERNYRKSFDRIIRQKGFDVLIQKMRKKLGSR